MKKDADEVRPKMSRIPRVTFGPIKRCIYCGADTDMTTEHIIPYGLGGNLELLKGSCKECAKTTGRFEQICLQKTFNLIRIKYGVSTRNPKKRIHNLPIKIEKQDGTEIEKFIGPDELPRCGWALPLLDTPTYASQLLSSHKPCLHVQMDNSDAEILLENGDGISPVSINLGAIDMHSFARMLAKIAHSYAYAVLPQGSFEPLLNKMILKGNNDFTFFVGGELEIPPAEDFMYELTMGQTRAFNGVKCLCVRIRLFSFLGTPVYVVAVGTPIGDPLSNLRSGKNTAAIKLKWVHL